MVAILSCCAIPWLRDPLLSFSCLIVPANLLASSFLRDPLGKQRLFTALFRAVGSNCGNGYTIMLFQDNNKYYFLSIIKGYGPH